VPVLKNSGKKAAPSSRLIQKEGGKGKKGEEERGLLELALYNRRATVLWLEGEKEEAKEEEGEETRIFQSLQFH